MLNKKTNEMLDKLYNNALEKYSYLRCNSIEELAETMYRFGMERELIQIRNASDEIIKAFNN